METTCYIHKSGGRGDYLFFYLIFMQPAPYKVTLDDVGISFRKQHHLMSSKDINAIGHTANNIFLPNSDK